MNEVLLAIQVILGSVVAASVFFVWGAYGLFFNWTHTRAGRALFYLLTALVISFIVSIVTLWLGRDWGPPEWHLRQWASILVLLLAAIAVIKMAIALVQNWRKTGKVLDLEERARNAQAVLNEIEPRGRTPK